MGDSSQKEFLKLPATLARKLARFRALLLFRLFSESMLWAACGFLLLFLFCLTIDRLFIVPPPFRFLFFTGVIVLLLFLCVRLKKRQKRFQKGANLARIIMDSIPRFGDRLLGVLELQTQDAKVTHFSPQLRAAALQKVSEDAETVAFEKALPRNTIRRSSLLLLLLLFTISAIGYFFTPVLRNTTQRYLLPHKEITRFTYVKFQPTEKVLYVALNEPAQFRLKIANLDELSEVPRAYASIASKSFTEEYQKEFTFSLPPLKQAEKLKIKVQDARKTILVQPVARPEIISKTVRVRYPSHLKKKEISSVLNSDTLDVLHGSEVQLVFQLNATIDSHEILKESMAGLKFTQKKDVLQSNWISVTESGTVSLQFVKRGIYSLKNQGFQLNSVQDSPPRIELFSDREEVVLLEDEELNLQLFAKDDYGINALSLECYRYAKRVPETFLRSINLREKELPAARVQLNHLFSPASLELRPQRFFLYASAKDAYPKRAVTYSQPIEIEYLSYEDHAKRLQGQFIKAVTKLEQILESEILIEKTNSLTLTNNYERESQLIKVARTSYQAERANQKKVDELANHLKGLFQESIRNTPLDRGLKIQIAQLSQAVQALSEVEYKELLLNYESLLSHQLGVQKTRRELQSVIYLEENLINLLQDIIDQANAINRTFESANFSQRISQAAARETKIAALLHSFFQKNAGSEFSQLSAKTDQALERIVKLQNANLQSLKALQDDLRDYSKRTEKEEFSQLSHQMESSGYQLELRKIARSIDRNHSYLAKVNARKWAALISSWSQEISPQATSSGVAQGRGSGNSLSSSGDLDFMLRVIELVKKQQDIREKTRLSKSL